MEQPNTTRDLLRRWLATPLLCLYLLSLAFLAWREEVRPDWLAGAARAGEDFWLRFGIRPGVAVFSDDRIEARDAKDMASCFHLRGIDRAAGRFEDRYPIGPCPPGAPRLYFAREDAMIFQLLGVISFLETMRATSGVSQIGVAVSNAGLLTLKQHFELRDRRAGGSYPEYSFLWKRHQISYETGETSVQPFLLMNWSTEPGTLPGVGLYPAPELIREKYGEDAP